MKKQVNFMDYAGLIIDRLDMGVLMTTKDQNKVNTMTLRWGTIGIHWSKKVFVAYVRKSCFTHEILNKHPYFTINIPTLSYDKKILGICGSKSGRNVNKIELCNLHLTESEIIDVPGIKEFPLTLECKVIAKIDQNVDGIDSFILDEHYPIQSPTTFAGTRENNHTAFYGEIVNAYIIEEENA